MNFSYNCKLSDSKLVVFFSGWGLEDLVVQRIKNSDYNYICFYDYRSSQISTAAIELIEKYPEKFLICWSMGIMLANISLPSKIKFNKKIALCGSALPINNQYGIPQKIYQRTVKQFSQQVMIQFFKNMGITENISKNFHFKDNLRQKKEELQILANYQPQEVINFDKVIIAENDRIFPMKNLLNYWQKTKVQEITGGHYPFEKFNSWKDILADD